MLMTKDNIVREVEEHDVETFKAWGYTEVKTGTSDDKTSKTPKSGSKKGK